MRKRPATTTLPSLPTSEMSLTRAGRKELLTAIPGAQATWHFVLDDGRLHGRGSSDLPLWQRVSRWHTTRILVRRSPTLWGPI
jgi:hypothetical protein